MTQNRQVEGARVVRFRGTAATIRSQHIAAATTVAVLAGLALVGVLAPVAIIAFFAIGAGAGYSLSGSV